MKISERIDIKEHSNGDIVLPLDNYPYLKEVDASIKGVVEFTIKAQSNRSESYVMIPYRGEPMEEFSETVYKRVNTELAKHKFEEMDYDEKSRVVNRLPDEVVGAYKTTVLQGGFNVFNEGEGPNTPEMKV